MRLVPSTGGQGEEVLVVSLGLLELLLAVLDSRLVGLEHLGVALGLVIRPRDRIGTLWLAIT